MGEFKLTILHTAPTCLYFKLYDVAQVREFHKSVAVEIVISVADKFTGVSQVFLSVVNMPTKEKVLVPFEQTVCTLNSYCVNGFNSDNSREFTVVVPVSHSELEYRILY